jgi:hypothetical protein
MIHAIECKVVAVPVVSLLLAGAHGKFRCAFIIHRGPLGRTLINRVAVTETKPETSVEVKNPLRFEAGRQASSARAAMGVEV